MRRYLKIGTACLLIVLMTVDTSSACWLFRRLFCQPCWTSCPSPPQYYDSCSYAGGMIQRGAAMYGGVPTYGAVPQAYDALGQGTTIMSPSMRVPWPQPQPGITRPTQPTPANGIIAPRTLPSDSDARTIPPAERSATPREPMPDTEPMPDPRREPPADDPFAPRTTEPRGTAPRDTLPSDTAPPRIDQPTTPADDPFAPRTTPGTTRPTEPAVPTDDPFAPRSTTPGATQPAQPTTPQADPFAPPRAETPTPATRGAADDPFAPPSDATKSSATNAPVADPFAPPSDAAKTPMSEVRDAPTDEATDAKEAQPASEPKQEPAKDDPFAEPPGPRLSDSKPAPEPADAMRVWTDATGKHQVRGQMTRILIAQGKVRILKETGKYTTVPLAKLSDGDRQFVAQYSSEPSLLLAENR